MTPVEIFAALEQLRPGTSWHLYEGNRLVQNDDGSKRVPVPTMDEIKAIVDGTSYRALREKSYPPIGDQLDALWKGEPDASQMKARIQAVKDRFPKPQ
jgi:hypothetical protein